MSCGYNGYGQLGHGDNIDRMIFEEIKRVAENVCKIICGNRFNTFILLTNGRILSCGYNYHGNLGHYNKTIVVTFEEIRNIPGPVSEIFFFFFVRIHIHLFNWLMVKLWVVEIICADN